MVLGDSLHCQDQGKLLSSSTFCSTTLFISMLKEHKLAKNGIVSLRRNRLSSKITQVPVHIIVTCVSLNFWQGNTFSKQYFLFKTTLWQFGPCWQLLWWFGLDWAILGFTDVGVMKHGGLCQCIHDPDKHHTDGAKMIFGPYQNDVKLLPACSNRCCLNFLELCCYVAWNYKVFWVIYLCV